MTQDFKLPALKLAPWLLYLTAAVLPFLVGVWMHASPSEPTVMEVSSVTPMTITISSSGVPTDMLWIWPRVAWLLFTGILSVLFWRDLGFRWKDPFILLWLAYLALVTLSVLLAPGAWHFKLLGGLGRLDGALYQLALGLWSIFAYLVFRRIPETRINFLKILAVVGGLESVVVILQRLGIDPVGALIRGQYFPTTVGTIGHPGMVAGLLLVAFFAAAYLAYARPRTAWGWLLLALLIAVGIGVTTNKTTFYAILAVTLLLLLWTRRREALVLFLVFAIGIFGIAPLIPNHLGFARSYTDPQTGFTRLIIWKLAVEVIQKTPGQPLIGGGPDGFLVGLITKVPVEKLLEEYRIEYGWPESAKIKNIRPLYTDEDPLRARAFLVEFEDYPEPGKNRNIIFRYNLDKAHNLFLDRAVAYGVVSAVISLLFFLVPLWRFLRWGRRRPFAETVLFAGLAALFIYYLTWFPVPQVEPLHTAYMALIWAWLERVT